MKQEQDKFTIDAFSAPRRGRPHVLHPLTNAQRHAKHRAKEKQASASFLEGIKALGDCTEHQRGNRAALLAKVVSYICQSGDGEFAVILGDALQALPEVSAYQQNLFETNILFTEASLKVQLAGYRGIVDSVLHKNPHLVGCLNTQVKFKPSGV